ncbi:CAP domain-containing protein [Neobacillus novalis]|uniref:CAP domain-containing protein n=1 Tax=Neobacillus novalis TaxID=220687 RepID=A0AA95MP15_9BACI|nr:CAP domain-containing protein [Neobacillus novalis]WHY87592.1 CAP domain-containing protein [Neobacillus novalis]
MIKKPVGVLLTAILTVGLAACNNNDKNNLNEHTDNRIGMNTNRNNPIDVRYNNGNDDNGPLTVNDRYRGRDDLNLFNVKDNNRKNDDMISAYQTTMNSDQYPHTRAVLIKDAKYQFITMDSRKGNWFQSGVDQQVPSDYQRQRPTTKTPVQPNVPQQTQPAPNQTQPTPAVPDQTQPIPAAPKQTQPAPAAPKQPGQTQSNAPATGTVSQFVQQVIDLTNTQRSKNGLPALKADIQLNSVAQKKALDMQQNHYFSHTSPTYGSPFDMMRDFGVTYKSAGENIAQGQRSPQEVVTAWMNSEGHRKNILSANYTHIGVGFEEAGKHWSQMFIGK